MKIARKPIRLALPFASLLTLSLPAAAVPFAIEGPVRSVVADVTPIEPTTANPSPTQPTTAVLLDCVGKKVVVDASTALRTPAGSLSVASLARAAAFPNSGNSPLTGQPRAGFVGGTCILNADDAITTSFGGATYPRALSLLVEVAENVLVGVGQLVSANGNLNKPVAGSTILGVPIATSDDARMPTIKFAAGMYTKTAGGPISGLYAYPAKTEYVRNAYGFGVTPSTIPAGDVLTAGGYIGNDGTLYAHTIESTTGTLISQGTVATQPTRPSIQRAQCLTLPGTVANTFTSSYAIRGGCVLPATTASATVTLYGVRNGVKTTLGTAACIQKQAADALNGKNAFGLYAFAAKNLAGACPGILSAEMVGAATVDIVTPDLR